MSIPLWKQISEQSLVMTRKRTDIFSSGRCGGHPIGPTINAVSKGEGVIVFAKYGASHTFDGRDRGFGRTRRDHMDLISKKFLSLKKARPTSPANGRNPHTSPKILIPSFTSWTQPLNSSSRAVMGCSGVETSRPWSTQCCNLSRFTAAYSFVFLEDVLVNQ